MRKILCFFGEHQWRYYSEKHRFVYKEPRLSMMSGNRWVPLRKCRGCGKTEHHLMPVCHYAGSFFFSGGTVMNWRPWKYAPGAKVFLQVTKLKK